jgi:hypothetical protein
VAAYADAEAKTAALHDYATHVHAAVVQERLHLAGPASSMLSRVLRDTSAAVKKRVEVDKIKQHVDSLLSTKGLRKKLATIHSGESKLTFKQRIQIKIQRLVRLAMEVRKLPDSIVKTQEKKRLDYAAVAVQGLVTTIILHLTTEVTAPALLLSLHLLSSAFTYFHMHLVIGEQPTPSMEPRGESP